MPLERSFMNALESLLFVGLLFVGLLFGSLLFVSLLFVTRSIRGCKEQAVVASLTAVCKGMCSQARWLARSQLPWARPQPQQG